MQEYPVEANCRVFFFFFYAMLYGVKSELMAVFM